MSRVLPLVLALAVPVAAADVKDVQALLARPIIGPRQARLELEEHVRPRIPTLPPFGTTAEWEKYAAGIRRDVLDKVVFRGEAAAVARREGQGRVARHDRRRPRLPHQEAPLRSAARPVDSRPALRAGEARRQGAGLPQRQRPRRQGQGGRLQADPLHQPGQARHDRAERRVVRHGPAARAGLSATTA